MILRCTPVPPHTTAGLVVARPEPLVTQVELCAVPVGHRALVRVSRLLLAVGFQRGAHDEPGEEEKMREDAGGRAPSGERLGPGAMRRRRRGVGGGDVSLGEGRWAFSGKSRGLGPTPGPGQDVEIRRRRPHGSSNTWERGSPWEKGRADIMEEVMLELGLNR